jgi:hypothetical protein
VSYTLDTVSTDTGVTLICPGSRELTVQITNAAVNLEFGHGAPASMWGPLESYLPSLGTLARPEGFDAVRVRSRTPGRAATVFLTAT